MNCFRLRGFADDVFRYSKRCTLSVWSRDWLGSQEPITAPPINSAPPDFAIFPCSKGENETRNPYWQLENLGGAELIGGPELGSRLPTGVMR